MAHTPGPWTIENDLDSDEVFIFANDAPSGQKMPAVCYGDNSENNARLIAAAPAMLEALELLEKNASKIPPRYRPDGLIRARAAIKLAKGE